MKVTWDVNWTEKEGKIHFPNSVSWAFVLSINVSSRLFNRWKRSHLCVYQHTHPKLHTICANIHTYIHSHTCPHVALLQMFKICWDHMDVLLNDFEGWCKRGNISTVYFKMIIIFLESESFKVFTFKRTYREVWFSILSRGSFI